MTVREEGSRVVEGEESQVPLFIHLFAQLKLSAWRPLINFKTNLIITDSRQKTTQESLGVSPESK